MDKKRCMGCMRVKSANSVCEHCGFDESVQNASHQLSIGTVLREQYLIGRVLGQGGFGITYLGWDLYLDLPVAIKEYYPGGAVMRDTSVSLEVVSYSGEVGVRFRNNKERFMREAKMLARFSEVLEIVQVKNFFLANNTAYIVMEYVEGTTLKQYVAQQGGKLSVEETLSILRPVMEALGKVHRAGLVHRDISPDNIMMLPGGGVKLLDFGAVRDFGSDGTASTEAILKQGYAPIEQYQRRGNLGPWTDVYGLCATICFCITGKVPTEASERLLVDEDLHIRENAPELSVEQEAVLVHGMELRVENRIASMEELMEQLFARLEPEPVPQPAPEPESEPELPTPKRKWYGNWRIWTAVGTSAVLILTAVGLSAMLLGGKDEPIEPSVAPQEVLETPAQTDAQKHSGIKNEIKTGQCGDNVFYEFDETTGGLSILGSGPMYDYDPWGPRAGWSPFFIMDAKSVTVGEGVTRIGAWAFCGIAGTANLSEVALPNSLEAIGYGAFQKTSIEAITIPDSVNDIEGEAFSGCKQLKTIDLPENLQYIRWEVFRDSGLEEIEIPDSVLGIEDYAFAGTKLRSVLLPESGCRIERNVFSNCAQLKSVFVGKCTAINLDLDRNRLFTDENGEIPKDLTIYGYTNSSMEIYAKHFGINFHALGQDEWEDEGQCGDNVFYHLDINGHFLYIDGEGEMWDFNDEKRHNYTSDEMQALPTVPWESNKGFIVDLYIDEGVTCVGEYAFDDCVNLISMYLGGVQRIGEKAFQSTKLDELVDNGNLQVIENHAFNACDVLYHVELGDNMEKIGGAAFGDCNGLIVYLPGSVELYDENGVTPFNTQGEEIPQDLIIVSDENSPVHEFAQRHELTFMDR